MDSESQRQRLAALTRARHRVTGALPGSPEWDAALANVEDIERSLDEAVEQAEPAPPPPPPDLGDARAVLHFGPRSWEHHGSVRGTLVGRRSLAEVIHQLADELADRSTSAREFLRALDRVALERGFVLESQASDSHDIVFYGWHDESKAWSEGPV